MLKLNNKIIAFFYLFALILLLSWGLPKISSLFYKINEGYEDRNTEWADKQSNNTNEGANCPGKSDCPEGCVKPTELSGNCSNILTDLSGNRFKTCPYECPNINSDCEYDQCCTKCGIVQFYLDDNNNATDKGIHISYDKIDRLTGTSTRGNSTNNTATTGTSTTGITKLPNSETNLLNDKSSNLLNFAAQSNAKYKKKNLDSSEISEGVYKGDIENARVINNYYYYGDRSNDEYPLPGQATHDPTTPSYQQTLDINMTDVINEYYKKDKNRGSKYTREYPCQESVTGFFTDCGVPGANTPCYSYMNKKFNM